MANPPFSVEFHHDPKNKFKFKVLVVKATMNILIKMLLVKLVLVM